MVEILQAPDFFLNMIPFVANRDAARFSSRQGCCVAHFVLQRESSNHRRVPNGLMTLGGVDDEINLFVFQQVGDMRTTLPHLVDCSAFNPTLTQHLCRPMSPNQSETQGQQFFTQTNQSELV